MNCQQNVDGMAEHLNVSVDCQFKHGANHSRSRTNVSRSKNYRVMEQVGKFSFILATFIVQSQDVFRLG